MQTDGVCRNVFMNVCEGRGVNKREGRDCNILCTQQAKNRSDLTYMAAGSFHDAPNACIYPWGYVNVLTRGALHSS